MKVNDFRTFHAMNQDADERLLKTHEIRSKRNLRSGHTENQNLVEAYRSTLELDNPYYNAEDVVVGSVEDIKRDAVVFFIANPELSENKIIRVYSATKTVELILKHHYLAFQLDRHISADIIGDLLYWTDGYFRSYLNNDFNPPRKINMEKAKKYTQRYNTKRYNYKKVSDAGDFYPSYQGYTAYIGVGVPTFSAGTEVFTFTNDGDVLGQRHRETTGRGVVKFSTTGLIITDRPWAGGASPQTRQGDMLAYEPDMYFGIDWQALDRIKYPPMEAPGVSYITDSTKKTNHLRGKLFQFSYRWMYDDNENSVWSPFSDVPLPTKSEFINGSYDDLVVVDNVINVWINSGPQEVKRVEIAVREGNTGDWKLAKRWEKYDEAGDYLIDPTDSHVVIPSEMNVLFQFYNNEVFEGLPQDDISRPFDYVAQISANQELVEKNRLIDSNYVEGFNNVDTDLKLTSFTSPTHIGTTLSDITYGPFIYPTYGNDMFFARSLFAHQVSGGDGDIYLCSILNIYPLYTRGGIAVVNIDCRGFNYKDEYNDTASIPAEYYGKFIRGLAVVDTTGKTFEQFRNEVISQLRYSSSFNSVIAFSNNNSMGFDRWGEYTSIYPNGSDWNNLPYNMNPNHVIGIVMMSSPEDDSLGWDPSLPTHFITATTTNIADDFAKISTFKSGMDYTVGVVYFDRAGRCGAVNPNLASIRIPHLAESGISNFIKKNTIRWELSSKPPDWSAQYALFYAPRTSINYYLYANVKSFKVGSKTGTIVLDVNTDVLFSGELMPKFNIKLYEWEQGDRCRFVFLRQDNGQYKTVTQYIDKEILGMFTPPDDAVYYLRDKEKDHVTDVNGNKISAGSASRIIIEDFDYAGNGFTNDNVIVEIYRPSKETSNILFYQFTSRLPIIEPYTANRCHGIKPTNYTVITGDAAIIPTAWDRRQTATLSARGTFKFGNAYIFNRFTGRVFPCESQWYSDFYDSQDINIGRPNVINKNMRRQQFYSNFRWGGRYIENTQVNDLSKFNATDFDSLAEKYEEINYASEKGYTLRVLQKNKPTSIFIGKAGLKQADLTGKDLVTITDQVVGSVNVLDYDYGTIFPDAVVETSRYIYFYDIYQGVFCRWADNGIEPVSDYGMKKWFRDQSRALLESGVDNVKVIATHEREFDNVIISFIDLVNPENNETIVFHEPDNTWTNFLDLTPDYYGQAGIYLYSSILGKIYLHNKGTDYNHFYGAEVTPEIEFVTNAEPTRNKVLNALEVHSDKVWSVSDVTINNNGTVMQSRINENKFVNREGVKVAAFMRDMLTSGVSKLSNLVNGRPLRGQSAKITLEGPEGEDVSIFGANVKHTISE